MKTTKNKQLSNAPAKKRGNRLEVAHIPETLFKRALRAAKANNQNKSVFIKAAIDLYCDVQEGKATVRRTKK